MAEIEAFLRTGEGPPAAPEPRSVRSLPVAGGDPPADPFVGRDGPAAGRAGRFSRFNPFHRGLPLGRPLAHRRGGWRLPGWRLPGRIKPAPDRTRPPGLPPEPPRWTALRALAVASVLVVLLILPTLYPGRSTSSGGQGTDHASAAPSGTGYSFLRRNRSGTPVRWNPCSPVYYFTNFSAAPAYAAADLQSAVSQISQATGILFVDKGATTTFPAGGGYVSSDGSTGPVVIAWAGPGQDASIPFAAGATGADAMARSEPLAAVDQTSGHGVYVTGTVLIGSTAGRLAEGFGPGSLGVLLLHELGHLMGLANVTDAGQVMDTGVLATPTRTLGSGDLAGLKRVGTASGCLDVPANPTLQPS